MAPKTEEQNFLERLGVLDATTTRDSDFNVTSESADDEFAEERARFDALEAELNNKAERLIARENELNSVERQNKSEAKRLKRWEKELSNLEAELELTQKRNCAVDEGEAVLDDVAMDAYRKKKKAERLIKNREDAATDDDEVRSVWSTGWNT
jgi:chromosome segregation ATPase